MSKTESIEVCIPVTDHENVDALFDVLPSAVLYAHESVAADCKGRGFEIRTHTIVEGVDHEATVRNHILEDSEADCVVLAREHLACVWRLVGNQRKVDRTDYILEAIDTLHQCAQDLGISTFTFPKTKNKMLVDASYRPFQFTASSLAFVGLRGRSRNRKFDPGFGAQAEIDFLLNVLKTERIVLQDNRFCFEFAKGASPSPSAEVASRLLKRWGSAVDLRAFGQSKGRRPAIKVSRFDSQFSEDN